MATPESKLEEFREVGLAMASPLMSAILPGGKPIEALMNVFSVAHGQAEQSIQTNLVQQVWAGIIDPSQLSIRVNGADAAVLMAQVQASEAKRAAENHMFLITLNQLSDAIDEMEARADEMERGFAEKYGESWREDLALKILDEDDIPQRLDGESLVDYRERVEQALIEEMIDENGEIKDKYKNDPELKDRAEWAKVRWDTRQAKLEAEGLEAVYNDPNATDAERQASLEGASQASLSLAKHMSDDEEVAAKMDAEFDSRQDKVSQVVDQSKDAGLLALLPPS